FLALPRPDHMREAMRRLSARPHHVGSAFGRENAEWILARFREWGWEAEIETFHVLFPTPKERLVEMIAPRRLRLALEEPAVASDPTSAQKAEQLPSYNAYSIDGDVTGPLVYVNYGLPEDYEELERRGVSAKGAIVLARYGRSWRGTKPKVAAEHGAVGCLIYSDPRDDGYFKGDVFPKGPMRPKDGVQRGSVMDFASSSPGDPLTPGVGATRDAKRLAVTAAPSLTRVPVLPLSYADAQPLLEALEGPLAPEGWRGALPIPYRLGPGPAVVRLKVAFDWDVKPAHDVVARIAGAERKDEWIVRGNHHDAWVNGADDPVSGLVPLLEEARALGLLVREGWRPQRTIVYCAWDAEEPMLLGSTEWAETHAEELRQKAVAYLNTDSNGRGFLGMQGSHTLERFMNDVARSVEDPETKVPVWKRARARAIAEAPSAERRNEVRERADLRLGALGSGSDYTAFIDHLGVASLNLGFGGMDDGGIYHSIYDSFHWYTSFSDTDFAYGRALAQTVGLAVLRLADADLLPFEFRGLADTTGEYLKDLKELLAGKQAEVAETNRQIEEGVFEATLDPRRPTVAPRPETVPPHLNFAPLENAVAALERSASRYAKARARVEGRTVPPDVLGRVNAMLLRSERLLLSPAGLPRRPWFKHLLYAPGVYSGYGAKTMPGVREAIEQKRWTEADGEIARVANALEDVAALAERAAAELDAVPG
ncbi:MAG TPA: transferrin receptor-like dimerization domain-containing protein, partial [Vicinamibacteria bacterium]